jgi:hypothetical protein
MVWVFPGIIVAIIVGAVLSWDKLMSRFDP